MRFWQPSTLPVNSVHGVHQTADNQMSSECHTTKGGEGPSRSNPEATTANSPVGSSGQAQQTLGHGDVFPINGQTTGHIQTWGEDRSKRMAFDPRPIDTVDVTVDEVDKLLRSIEGKTLDFYSFARDTPKGKNCVCHILHSRATTVFLPSTGNSTDQDSRTVPVMCIELVANRFLRRMARIVVSTAIRESLVPAARKGGDKAALLHIAESLDRLETAIGAPPEGLCLAGAGYSGSGSYGRLDGCLGCQNSEARCKQTLK